MTEPFDTTTTKSESDRNGSVSVARPARHRKSYPEEFKREAVELLATSGRPLAQVALQLGVSADSLRLWRKQADVDDRKRERLVSEQREEPPPLRNEDRPVKRTRLWVSVAVVAAAVAALVVVFLVSLAGGDTDSGGEGNQAGQAPQASQAVDGSFVGRVSGTKAFVAVVAAPAEGEGDERAVQIYVADGKRIDEWFSGSIADNQFVAETEDGEAEAEGTLTGKSVSGMVDLGDGEPVRYRARPPAGAAGLYDLSASSRGMLRGSSAAGLGVAGRIELPEGTGFLRLADGKRLTFQIAEAPAADLAALRPGRTRLIILPGGRLVGAGKSRPAADSPEGAFFILG